MTASLSWTISSSRAIASGRSSLATSGISGAPASLSGLHEAQRHVIDAVPRTELKIRDVLVSEPGRRQFDAWGVDALVLAEDATIHDRRSQLMRIDVVNPQLDPAVVEQQRAASRHRFRQIRICRRDSARLSGLVANHDPKPVAAGQSDRLAVRERAGANLRSAQILQQRHDPAGVVRGLANARHHLAVTVARAVRKIETEDVDVSRQQCFDHRGAVRRGAKRRDDLCPAHQLRLLRVET
jgi:hypothetical protein